MLVCSFVCANRTRDRGCSKHPVFPAPSVSRGQEILQQTSGDQRREIAKACPAVIATRWLAMTWIGRGVLDIPPSLGPALLLRRRFATARVGAAGEKSQCQPADRKDRDQLLDADGADHLDAGGNQHRI